MKTSLKHAMLSALLAGPLLASCQLKPYEIPADEAYTRAFIKQFGIIDKNQDWNMATRGSVTVNPGQSSNVQIYARSGNSYKIIGDFSDVNGTQTLNFDMLKGTTDIIVSNGLQAVKTTVGGNVDLRTSGTTRTVVSGETGIVRVSETDEYRYFTEEDVRAYTSILPEQQENTGKVTCDFTMISTGKFIFYPLFFWTSSWSDIGIYYLDENNERVLVDIYKNKEGDDFQRYTKKFYDSEGEHQGWLSYTHGIEQATDNIADSGDDNNHIIRSKGVVVDIPVGTVFGFYIHVKSNGSQDLEAKEESWRNYSELKYNSSEYRYSKIEETSSLEYINSCCIDKPLISTFTKDGKTYIGFEDWAADKTDLNDFVFLLDGDIPITTDKVETSAEWLVACEDLGNTGDVDFNDIVFSVSHVSGRTYATFTPLATGASLTSTIHFQEAGKDTETQLGEIHVLLNGQAPTFINTTSPQRGLPGAAIRLDVKENFSMAHINDENYGSNMGGFRIVTKRSEGDLQDAVIITSPEIGTAPAMICLPYAYTDADGTTYEWPWPQEYIHIEKAYPRFNDWVKNSQENDWYTKPEANSVVWGKFWKEGGDNTGEGGDTPTPSETTIDLTKVTGPGWTEKGAYSITVSSEYLNKSLYFYFTQTEDTTTPEVDLYPTSQWSNKLTAGGNLKVSFNLNETNLTGCTKTDDGSYIIYILAWHSELSKVTVQ